MIHASLVTGGRLLIVGVLALANSDRAAETFRSTMTSGTHYYNTSSEHVFDAPGLDKSGFKLRYTDRTGYEKLLPSGETYTYESKEVHLTEIQWSNVKAITFKSVRSKKGNADNIVKFQLKATADEISRSVSTESGVSTFKRKVSETAVIFEKDSSVDEFIAAAKALNTEWKLDLKFEDLSSKPMPAAPPPSTDHS